MDFDKFGTVSVLLLNTGRELDLCSGHITPSGETLCPPYVGNYDNDGKGYGKGFSNFQNYSKTEVWYHTISFYVFSVVKVELQFPSPYCKVTYVLTLIVVEEVVDFPNYSATERRRYAFFLVLALAIHFKYLSILIHHRKETSYTCR
jgi:hypothetical protein